MPSISKPTLFQAFLIATFLSVTACTSDSSSVGSSSDTSQHDTVTFLNPLIREYDFASDQAMDLLVNLKQLRAIDTSWTENHRRNITMFGLGAVANDPLGVMEKIGELWQQDQRKDLEPESNQVRRIFDQLQSSRTKLNQESVGMPELQRFRQAGFLAIDRQIRIIKDINVWYQGFMTRPAGESPTSALIALLDAAPSLFLDARLRWASAKSDLP